MSERKRNAAYNKEMSAAQNRYVSGLAQGITVGASVEFEFRQGKDGLFEIASIAPAPSGAAKPNAAAAKGAVTKSREAAPSGSKP